MFNIQGPIKYLKSGIKIGYKDICIGKYTKYRYLVQLRNWNDAWKWKIGSFKLKKPIHYL
ncbi:MAG: hypothetical protein C0417_11155 [Chlorobiaceae bacterium]|nr:hypothetical protein [Chlorobiaceae bacterium]